MKRLLCIWLPNWPIQRLRLLEPSSSKASELKAGEPQAVESGAVGSDRCCARPPIVLWREDAHRSRRVIACSTEAHRSGVSLGMPIAQASELVQGCCGDLSDSGGRGDSGDPGVSGNQTATPPIILPHDRHLDQAAIENLARLLQQTITPLMAVESLDKTPWAGHSRHQCESLLGDITGVAHLFGGEQGLLNAARQLLAARGLIGRMAIADSLGAAWALSHDGASRDGATRDGASGDCPRECIAPPGSLREAIEPLVVQALRIDEGTVHTLARLGITHIDQLLQLPRSGLAPRLGNHLVLRIAQALGEIDEPLTVHRAAAEYRETHLLQYPTSDQQILVDRVQRLTKKIGANLAARQRGALRMACRLDLVSLPPLTIDIGLFKPTATADHLSGLIIHRLESQQLAGLVQRLTLEVTLSGPLGCVQTSLFDPGLNRQSLSRLIDSLSGRLGREAVLGIKLQDNPLPEQAFRTIPLTGNSAGNSAVNSAGNSVGPPRPRRANDSQRIEPGSSRRHGGPSPRDPLRRPCSLLPHPIPLAVAFGSGPFHHEVTSTHLPDYLRLGGTIHTITNHWGPERIETGWWHGPSIRRDYYRIETDQGRWWWIFRNLCSADRSRSRPLSRWMLHGQFD